VVRVTRAIEFSSSLRYRAAGQSDAQNRELFGLAAEQHGHNYRLELTVRGEPDAKTGMVINLVELKAILEREVMSRFDHKDLNADMEFFKDVPPTPENLATVIHRVLVAALPAGLFERLRLYQDADLFVEVIGVEVIGDEIPGAEAARTEGVA